LEQKDSEEKSSEEKDSEEEESSDKKVKDIDEKKKKLDKKKVKLEAELEQLNEKAKKHEDECKSIENEMKATETELTERTKERDDLIENLKIQEELKSNAIKKSESINAKNEIEIDILLELSIAYNTLLLKLINEEQFSATDIDYSLTFVERINEYTRNLGSNNLTLETKLDLLQTTSTALLMNKGINNDTIIRGIKHTP